MDSEKRKKNNQSQSAPKKFQCDFKKVTLTYTMRMIKDGCLLKKKVLRCPSFGIWEDEETLQEMNKVPPGCKEWLQRPRIALSGRKLHIFAWYFQELNTQAAKKSNKKDN